MLCVAKNNSEYVEVTPVEVVQPTLQEKSITITENGTTEVVADSGYDGLAKVSVEANVQDNSLLNVIKGLNSYSTTNYPCEITEEMWDENSTTINYYRYYRNYNITKLVIPSNITSIEYNAFDGVRNCKLLEIKGSPSLGNYCFRGMYALEKIIAPNLKNMSNSRIFALSTSGTGHTQPLKEVELPELTYMYSYAFENRQGLEIVKFPKLKTIGESCFYKCDHLISVYIPIIGTIGSTAFGKCISLKVVNMSQVTAVPTLENAKAFSAVPKTCKFIIPDELYDEWIASTNWVSLYNNGYQFIKKSEYTEA